MSDKCELTHTCQEELTPDRRLNRPALPRQISWGVERTQLGPRAGRAAPELPVEDDTGAVTLLNKLSRTSRKRWPATAVPTMKLRRESFVLISHLLSAGGRVDRLRAVLPTAAVAQQLPS